MRNVVPIIGIILLIGLLGSFLTVLFYALLGAATGALLVFLVRLTVEKVTWFRAGKRIRTTAASAAAKADELEADAPEVMPEEMRHPAWHEAVAKRTVERERLARRYVDLRYRIVTTSAGLDYHRAYFDREAIMRNLYAEESEVEELVAKVFGITRPRNIIRGVNNQIHGVDLAPPRDEVLHLDRRFSALTDCRYGHADTHNIVGITGAAGVGTEITDVPAGRIVRECSVCAPVTRWTENP